MFAPANADETLAEISARLAKEAVICADFTQTKTLKVLNRPLVSQGKIIFMAGAGVLWQVREPFVSQILVKRDAVVKWDDKGAAQRSNFGQTPVFKALSQIFMAIFTGRVGNLTDGFKIEAEEETSLWRLMLTPREPAIAQIITIVQISGNHYVREILIAEGRGDQTSLKFSNMTGESCVLSAAEKGYFAQ